MSKEAGAKKNLPEVWHFLPKETKEALFEALEKSKTSEEFYSSIMVGNCPECGGDHTQDDDY